MGMEDLAESMLQLFLANLVLCRDDVEKEDVQFWSMLYAEEGATAMSREIIAYRNAKRRMKATRAGNPGNVVGVLIYNISHTGMRNRETMEEWRTKLDKGYSLSQVKRLDQAMDFIEELRGAFLTEQDVARLLGHAVNIRRVARLIQEEYKQLGE